MKIFTCEQIRKIDEFSIRNEPVESAELMERAAGKLFEWYISRFDSASPVIIFAGPGNNGGDGLALARMLSKNRYKTEVFFVKISGSTSKDWETNRKRLEKETAVPLRVIGHIEQFPEIRTGTVIIDAIFGSGLSRSADGLAAEVIRRINSSGAEIISVDIPSGLFGEDNGSNDPESVIRACHTLTFQFPKLSFMFPENERYTGEWHILPIGLHPRAILETDTPHAFLEKSMIRPVLKKRKKFDHKGRFGHCLLIGGSYGKMGAVVLGARAALRTGAGLVTCHIPSGGDQILQTAVPEAMAVHDPSELMISETGNTDAYSAIGIGPGMGTDPFSQKALYNLLRSCRKPMVIDADALNILSMNTNWLSEISPGTVLTPHPGEFERLAGKASSGFERLKKQIEFSAFHKCIVVLKGAFTSIAAPDGRVFFNSTGNPGMATAGSGDVLTGMILSLLGQGYDPLDAAVAGVYIHGLAGDIAAGKSGFESLIASDIINETGTAFNRIRDPE